LPKKDKVFYQGQIKTAEYFIDFVIPSTMAEMETLKRNVPSIMEMPDAAFA
jgi:hypothetical protein